MEPKSNDVELFNELGLSIKKVRTELAKAVIGQQSVINDLLACFLAEGHCLLIGVPGLAKTTLVQSLASSLDCRFNRIQFTPDLMPADITGSEILFEDRAAGVREFRFVKGPIFANIVLADEINRTPPKTQSALLQAMQEREVTSSGRTLSLPSPFWVLATQNPIEQEGTYPLPEAQQDRFMFSVKVLYPSLADELAIAKFSTVSGTLELKPVATAEQFIAYRDLVRRIPVADSVVAFAVSLARATRPSESGCPAAVKEFITWGAGPRASQYLVLAAKAYAVLEGRTTPDTADVRKAAFPVLRHRIVRSFHAEVEGVDADELIRRLLETVQ